MEHPELTRAQETADLLKIGIATLYRWRKIKGFPTPLTIGRIVFYDVQAIRAWMAVEGESDEAISAKALKALERSSK